MINTVLIEDHALVRAAMGKILNGEDGIKLVGEAATGNEGIKLVRELQPSVVILDFKLPDISGFEVTKKLIKLDSDIKVLVVTAATDDLMPFRLLEAGVRGFLSKDTPQEELLRAIKKIHTGQRVISPEIASRLVLAKVDYHEETVFSLLSSKETEVMMMVIQGQSVEEIAASLYLSPKTVHSHRSRIFKKLGVKNDVGLTLLAIRHDLLSLDEVE